MDKAECQTAFVTQRWTVSWKQSKSLFHGNNILIKINKRVEKRINNNRLLTITLNWQWYTEGTWFPWIGIYIAMKKLKNRFNP